MRRLIVLLVLAGSLSGSLAHAAVRAAGVTTPLGDEQLSDEATVTRWAHALFPEAIRADASPGARTVGKLRLFTEDREFEVYLVLESHIDAGGRTWLRVRIPGRPNGRTGWTLAENLGELTVVHTKLRIDRRALRATLTRGTKVIWSSRVGIGKAATPTPAGRFYVRERLRNLGGGGADGPRGIGTSPEAQRTDRAPGKLRGFSTGGS